jgi:3'-phosphoadenosine 5'-phosphosulfate sulfotransferase (PAPS reductase)/FAD synthetase
MMSLKGNQLSPGELDNLLEAIKWHGRKKKYNCIMGISGGLDSSTLLYSAVRYWNLKPLVIHFDNNWNAPEATHNMNQLVNKLGVDCINYKVNKQEYDRLNDAFLWAGVPDADIPNDIAMTKLMYDTAYNTASSTFSMVMILGQKDQLQNHGLTWMQNISDLFTTNTLALNCTTILCSHSKINSFML